MTKITFKDLPDTSTPLNANNLNTLQDNVEAAIPTLDNAVSTSSTNGVENQAITNYVDESISGDLIVDSIRTKNLFDINSIVAGDITGAFDTIRLSSRQAIRLEAGTYTFSSNMTSPFRFTVDIQDVGIPPLASYPTYILQSGWISAGNDYTFTIAQAGWVLINLSKENNATLTVSDVIGFNYQLEVGSTATTYKPYQDLTTIIESGTSNGWTWIKYSNGIAKCWKNKTWSVSVTNAWGTGLYYGTITGENFPAGLFIATPTISFQNITGTSVMCMNSSDASATNTGDIQVARGTSSSGAGGTISIHAIGKWKA